MHSDRPAPQEQIHDALNLDGETASIQAHYADWAATYDLDLQGDYVGPSLMLKVLSEALVQAADVDIEMPLADFVIADVGCGTGQVGALMVEAGATTLDGMDLSDNMIDVARKLDIYRSLWSHFDLNRPMGAEWTGQYDVAVCCGVFTLGHVKPEALLELANMVRPGGFFATSTRTSYYDTTHYQQVSDQLESTGRARLVHCVRDAEYTNDGDAHYWVYQLC
ncbi:MAG: class I SAM-dependent methyltransferase [Pseudomonadota bacterium]